MNFLALCQETARLCEVTGGGPTAVATATGENLSVVRWTREAWRNLQNMHDWNFMRKTLSFQTVAGQAAYTRAQMSAMDIKSIDEDSMRVYKTSVGKADEGFMVEWSWQDWYDTFDFGAQTNGRPMVYAIRPEDSAMMIGSIPDDIYTIAGRYWSQAQAMSVDDDTPAIDEDLQMIIPYRALLSYANREVAAELKQEAMEQYSVLMAKMMDRYLPAIGFGEPLA